MEQKIEAFQAKLDESEVVLEELERLREKNKDLNTCLKIDRGNIQSHVEIILKLREQVEELEEEAINCRGYARDTEKHFDGLQSQIKKLEQLPKTSTLQSIVKSRGKQIDKLRVQMDGLVKELSEHDKNDDDVQDYYKKQLAKMEKQKKALVGVIEDNYTYHHEKLNKLREQVQEYIDKWNEIQDRVKKLEGVLSDIDHDEFRFLRKQVDIISEYIMEHEPLPGANNTKCSGAGERATQIIKDFQAKLAEAQDRVKKLENATANVMKSTIDEVEKVVVLEKWVEELKDQNKRQANTIDNLHCILMRIDWKLNSPGPPL